MWLPKRFSRRCFLQLLHRHHHPNSYGVVDELFLALLESVRVAAGHDYVHVLRDCVHVLHGCVHVLHGCVHDHDLHDYVRDLLLVVVHVEVEGQ